MRYAIALMLAAAAFAQESGTQAGQAQSQAAAQQAAPAEQWLTGNIDFGYRFEPNFNGSRETYRSVVDLTEGPRLMGLEFTIQDPKRRLFDSINARGYNWGDPYNTAHVDASKKGIYNFRFNYLNSLYFNALPSYANPFLPGGYNQRWFDLRRRTSSFTLDLFQQKRIVPYLAYERNSGSGLGIMPWIGSGNQYPVPMNLTDRTHNFRGGVRFEFTRFQATLEQGGTTFKNDDSVFYNQSTTGDRTTPLFGRTLSLDGFVQAYRIRANSIYEKALVTAHPFSWVDFYGQFLYSKPETDVNYSDAATGSLAQVSTVLLYSGQLDSVTGSANKPHISANLGVELRPFRGFRIMESWTTDRFHDAAFALISEAFLGTATGTITNTTPLPDRQVVNFNRNEINLFWDALPKLTLRGGYRYEWGDATIRNSPLSPTGPFQSGKLNRQVAIAGANYRPIQKLTANVLFEGSSTTHAYFRTSLYNYNRFRARARYQAMTSLSVQASFRLLDNQNPIPGLQYDFRSRDNSFSLNWTPNEGKRFSVLAEYDRYTVRSSINYLTLPFFIPDVNEYRDNAHLATAAFSFGLPAVRGSAAKLTVGGSLAVNNGTRTSRFYQPMGRLSVPLGPHASWNTDWQWYGFNENLYQYEHFRTHLITTGLRLSL